MSQATQFPADLHAPPHWVSRVEGRTVATARWEDGSYGNDAAPSWILVDDSGAVHAQAFYYTSANAERFEKRLGDEPYVAVSIILEEEIVASCCVTPEVFASAVSAAAAVIGLSPADTLRAALGGVVGVSWQSIGTPA